MTQSYCETCSADSYGAPLCSTCEALAEVERLRFELEQAQVGVLNANEQVNELRAEVERLREALRAIAEYQPREVVKDDFAYDRMVRGFQDAARAALAGAPSETRREQGRALAERLREALEVLVAEIEAEHDEYEERHGERPQMRALQQARAALAGKAEP